MKYFTLYCLLLNTLNIFGQRVELRPNAVWSFHNIAKVQAVGLKLDALVKISGKHYLYSGFELIHGEGNAGLKNIQSTGVYSYNFDDPSTGQTSAWAYLFKDATLLKAKSARLHQAALKIGYLYRLSIKKNVLELSPYAYGNYVSGLYVLDVFDDIINYNPTGNNIDVFVVHYFFNYLDIGPGVTARYVFRSKKNVEPVLGLEYNYGARGGSWASFSIGLRLK